MNKTPPSHERDDNSGNPEIWDEFQWELFMREADKRTDLYMSLLEEYGDLPDSEIIIAKKMGWNHLLDGQDEEHWNEENNWIDFMNNDLDEGEDWKTDLAGDSVDVFDFENLPVYQKAFNFSLQAIDLLREDLEKKEDESVELFAQNVILPPAKIAGGFGMGFEKESIGGNIANCKRGLLAANSVLKALSNMYKKKILDETTYLVFHEHAKEVRDELAIWIVELRERFRKGL